MVRMGVKGGGRRSLLCLVAAFSLRSGCFSRSQRRHVTRPENGLVDYTELKGRLIPAGDSSVSSHLDPNASSLDLRGKSEGLKQMCLLRFPGVGRERAAEENPLSSATSVTGETK